MKIVQLKSFKAQLLVLLLGVSLVPFFVMGVVNYLLTSRILEAQVYEELGAVGEMRTKVLKAVFEGDLNLIEGLTNRDVFQNIEDTSVSRSGVQDTVAILQKRYSHFYEVFLLDRHGKVLGSSDEARIGTDRSSFSYFKEAIRGGNSIADVYKSPITGHIGYAIAAPVHERGGKTILGVLVAMVDVEVINKVAKDPSGLGKTGEFYLVNEDGKMVTGSRFKGDSVILTQVVDTEGVRRARAGEDVTGVFRDYRGEKVLGHYFVDAELSKLTSEKWCVVTEIDEKEAFEAVRRLGYLAFVIGCICLVLIILLGIYFSGSFARPINDLARIAQKISEGDLKQEIHILRDDEIGTLSKSFGTMVLNLRTLLGKIQEATGQITSSGNEILAASQEQASAAREQSSAVAETTSAAKELSTTSESVGESIKKVAQVASHAMAGMAKIKESIDKTNGMLNSLGEKSQKIGKITDLIDDVADQTNLLAVNASIEAARAGEQGRGFTVVADEIRKLADSTAKSTKDITSLIELIQHEMSNAIMSMEQSIQSVDEEARLAQQTTEKTKEIAMSTHQQISGAKQIADAMMNIDETMKQVAAGAQQSQVAVKQLTAMAGELNHLASKFKL